MTSTFIVAIMAIFDTSHGEIRLLHIMLHVVGLLT